MWEKEEKIIAGLGKMYPMCKIVMGYGFSYRNLSHDPRNRAWFIVWLCDERLKHRLPSLENYIKMNNPAAWTYYKCCFRIKEKCGKKRKK